MVQLIRDAESVSFWLVPSGLAKKLNLNVAENPLLTTLDLLS